jgi:hypothetical protein
LRLVVYIDAILEGDRKAPRKQCHTAHRIWMRMQHELAEFNRQNGKIGTVMTAQSGESEEKVKSLEETPEKHDTQSTKESSKATKKKAGRIVDETDQYLGKSIIITGTKKP